MKAKKTNILLIDDDELIKKIIEMFLDDEHYAISHCRREEEIGNTIKKTKPGLILLDIRIPGTSGHKILKTLKDKKNSIPVIMLSVENTAKACIEAVKAGAVDYITKPFTKEELRSKIEEALKNHGNTGAKA